MTSSLLISILGNVPINTSKTNNAVSPVSIAMATTMGTYRPPASFVNTSREPFKDTHTSVYSLTNIKTIGIIKGSFSTVSHLVSSLAAILTLREHSDHSRDPRGVGCYISAASSPDSCHQHGLRLSGLLDAQYPPPPSGLRLPGPPQTFRASIRLCVNMCSYRFYFTV